MVRWTSSFVVRCCVLTLSSPFVAGNSWYDCSRANWRKAFHLLWQVRDLCSFRKLSNRAVAPNTILHRVVSCVWKLSSRTIDTNIERASTERACRRIWEDGMLVLQCVLSFSEPSKTLLISVPPRRHNFRSSSRLVRSWMSWYYTHNRNVSNFNTSHFMALNVKCSFVLLVYSLMSNTKGERWRRLLFLFSAWTNECNAQSTMLLLSKCAIHSRQCYCRPRPNALTRDCGLQHRLCQPYHCT
jgi:hypothetical protein